MHPVSKKREKLNKFVNKYLPKASFSCGFAFAAFSIANYKDFVKLLILPLIYDRIIKKHFDRSILCYRESTPRELLG